MRKGASGMAIAAGILGVLAVLFGGLFLHAQSEITRLTDILQSSSPEQIAQNFNNGRVSNLISSAAETAAKLDLEVSRSQKLQGDLINANAEAENLNRIISGLRGDLQVKNEQLESERRRIAGLSDQIRNFQTETNARQQAEKDRLQNWYDEARAEAGQNQALAASIKEAMEELARKSRATIQGLRQDLASLQRQNLSWGTGGARTVKKGEGDGQVLEVDLPNKFVVVNLGRLQKVKAGTRFSVIRWRFNRWDDMGEIEIVDVKDTTSTALIVEQQQQRMVCPATGWVAPNPAMKYSPYAVFTTEDQVEHPLELVPSGVEGRLSMNIYDPILKNDKIYNPFFNPNKQLKFVLIGQPQFHGRDEIRARIQDAGGLLVDALAPDVDYVIVASIPEASEVRDDRDRSLEREEWVKIQRTAQAQGIPEMREVDLFPYLDD